MKLPTGLYNVTCSVGEEAPLPEKAGDPEKRMEDPPLPRNPHDLDLQEDMGAPKRAILIGVTGGSSEESMEELARLAETLDYEPCAELVQVRDAPDPATYLGSGKVEELRDAVAREGASVIIVDGVLSPVQARNLEDRTETSVMDRTDLILGIFAARAGTSEGKLQVEIARLKHQLTRLSGHGVEMSNPGAGIGTRGPGEQKIEIDRRILRSRISRLSKELDRVSKTRSEQRKRRRESGIPIVALVGYTNAGKSTLFNCLTGEEAYADDKLFATLDPWTRKWTLTSGETLLLVDTVGFIRGLPVELVAAFRATLEESVDADVLIHVVDISSKSWPQQMATVEDVLSDLGVVERPRIMCFNKCDKVGREEVELALRQHPGSLAISALWETGLQELESRVLRELCGRRELVTWKIPYSKWDVVFEIRRAGVVRKERHEDDGAVITCELSPEDVGRFSRKLGIQPLLKGTPETR